MSPPKYPNNRHVKNISALKPSLVIPSHYIAIKNNNISLEPKEIADWYRKIVMQDWVNNKYITEETIEVMVNLYLGAKKLVNEYPNSQIITSSSIELFKDNLSYPTSVIMFADCLGTYF